jgi:hypothetical protein
VAELADALDSKSSDRKVVEVQVLSPVLSETKGLEANLLQVLFAFHASNLKQI